MSSKADLPELVRALKLIGDCRAQPDLVDEVLADFRPTARALWSFLSFERGRYRRNLVVRNEHFELLVNCWDRGARSPVHGHAGQRCWFLPLAGEFRLEDYEQIAGGHAPGPASLRLSGPVRKSRPGHRDLRDEDNDVHRVSVAPGQRFAVSLHLYSRPIDECLVYDLEHGLCYPKRLTYDEPRATIWHSLPGRLVAQAREDFAGWMRRRFPWPGNVKLPPVRQIQ